MSQDKKKIVRYTFFILGAIFFILFLLYFINLIEMIDFNNFSFTDELLMSLKTILILGFLTYIFLKISLSWENYFRSLTGTLISFSIFFLMFFLVLFPLGNNSELIVNNIQPTIDILILDTIDSFIEDEYPVLDQNIKISLSNHTELMNVYNQNLTDYQANYIADIFELQEKSIDEKKIFTKVLVTSIFDEIQKNKELGNVPIPISQVKDMAQAQIQDLDLLKTIDMNLITNFITINESANVILILSQNETIEEINPANLSLEQTNMIWEKLELDENVSYVTKHKIISIFFTQVIAEFDKNNIGQEITIPIDTIKHILPEQVKNMMNYDLFSKNNSIKINALNSLREECNVSLETINTDDVNYEMTQKICEGLLMTEYDNIIASIQNENISSQIETPIDMSTLTEPISSIEKIENKFESIKSLSFIFIVVAIVLFLLSFITYYVHFRIKLEPISYLKITYFIFKSNFVSYLIQYVFIILLFFLVNQGRIMDIFSNDSSDSSLGLVSNINFAELPIMNVLEVINVEILTYSSIYFVLSLIVFLIFYYFKLKKDKEEEIRKKAEEAEKNNEIDNDIDKIKGNDVIYNGQRIVRREEDDNDIEIKEEFKSDSYQKGNTII